MKSIILFAALLSLFFPMGLHSQQDSFSLAISIVEDYGNEQNDLLANLAQNASGDDKTHIKNLIDTSSREKEDNLRKLKDVRWLEGSHDRLAKRVFNTVSAYTERHIKLLKELSDKLKPENKKEILSIIERAVSVKDRHLAKLKEMQLEEKALRRKMPSKEKPVPVIDMPPIEEPAKSKGIWER